MVFLALLDHEGTQALVCAKALRGSVEHPGMRTTESSFLRGKKRVWQGISAPWRGRHAMFTLAFSFPIRLSAQLSWVCGHPLEEGGSWPLLPLLPRKRKAKTQTEGVQHGSLPIEVCTITHGSPSEKKEIKCGLDWLVFAEGHLHHVPFAPRDLDYMLVAVTCISHLSNRE